MREPFVLVIFVNWFTLQPQGERIFVSVYDVYDLARQHVAETVSLNLLLPKDLVIADTGRNKVSRVVYCYKRTVFEYKGTNKTVLVRRKS